MNNDAESIHPAGELSEPSKNPLSKALEVDTFDGKLHVQWDPDVKVTPLGQLPFFIEFLKRGHRFEPLNT